MLACPMCGDKGCIHHDTDQAESWGWSPACQDDRCLLSGHLHWYDTRELAIAAWNRRAPTGTVWNDAVQEAAAAAANYWIGFPDANNEAAHRAAVEIPAIIRALRKEP